MLIYEFCEHMTQLFSDESSDLSLGLVQLLSSDEFGVDNSGNGPDSGGGGTGNGSVSNSSSGGAGLGGKGGGSSNMCPILSDVVPLPLLLPLRVSPTAMSLSLPLLLPLSLIHISEPTRPY